MSIWFQGPDGTMSAAKGVEFVLRQRWPGILTIDVEIDESGTGNKKGIHLHRIFIAVTKPELKEEIEIGAADILDDAPFAGAFHVQVEYLPDQESVRKKSPLPMTPEDEFKLRIKNKIKERWG